MSESQWEQWRATVRLHELDGVPFGRVAPSLRDLPTVIWPTPLGAYCDLSLMQIRQLKTHGEKRVRVIVQVFHAVHEALRYAAPQPLLAIRLAPPFCVDLERRLDGWLAAGAPPELRDVRDRLARPLVEQIRVDGGPELAQLAEGRLGLRSAAQDVRAQSQRLGVTRARIYQLLEDCGKIVQVRWPEGEPRLRALLALWPEEERHTRPAQMVRRLRELCFPAPGAAEAESERD